MDNAGFVKKNLNPKVIAHNQPEVLRPRSSGRLATGSRVVREPPTGALALVLLFDSECLGPRVGALLEFLKL